MATLAGNTIASTYALLLKIDNTGIAGDGTLRKVEDGDATDSALSLSDVSIAVDATDKIFLDGGTHSYIHESASDVVQIVAGGTVVFEGDTNSRISLSNNDGGTSNTVFGYLAGAALEGGGENNVLIGDNAGNDLTTGDQNVIIGHSAGDALVGGEDNTFIGQSAGGATTAGTSMVIIGRNAGLADITADAIGTVGVGYGCLQALTSGIGNVAVGYNSLTTTTTGASNTMVGHQTGTALPAGGDGNTAVGYQAFLSGNNDTTHENTCLGYRAGQGISNGFNNTMIGANVDVDTGSYDNCTAIGNNFEATQDDTVFLGNAATEEVWMASDKGATVHCAGAMVGISGTTSAGNIVVNDGIYIGANNGDNQIRVGETGGGSTALAIGNATITTSIVSDIRKKDIIGETNKGLSDVLNWIIKDFTFKPEWDRDSERIHTGAIAQEMYETNPELVDNSNDNIWKINWLETVPYLVKAVQELSAKVEALENA